MGVAAKRRRVVCLPNLARTRAMNAAIQDSIRRSGGEPSAVEIELPGVERVQSAAAVPLLARGELTGVLYLESERAGDFGPGNERLLRILGGHLAGALAVLQAYVVRSERARMLITISPGGLEELFVACGVPAGDEAPATDAVMPPMDELVRLFAGYGCDIVGPPPTLDEL
jgi:hypothetical protein